VLGELALYDVPLDDLGSYMPHVEAVTPDDVRDFVAAHVAQEPFIVLVGDAQQFTDAIRQAYADVTVIPAGGLDLNQAALVR
jgi:zinc protease